MKNNKNKEHPLWKLAEEIEGVIVNGPSGSQGARKWDMIHKDILKVACRVLKENADRITWEEEYKQKYINKMEKR